MQLKSLIGVIAVTALATTTGCAAHVHLQAPGIDAPEAERIGAYEKLKPISRYESITVSQFGQVVQQAPAFLQLAGGQRVYYPEDLNSVVEPTSPTAVAAEQSVSARQVRNVVAGVGTAFSIVGLGVSVAAFADRPTRPSIADLPSSSDPGYEAAMQKYDAARAEYDVQRGAKDTQLYVGIGIAAVGALVTSVGLLLTGRSVADAMSTAFDTYDKSLRQRLRLTGGQESPQSQPPNRTQVMLDRQLLNLSGRER